LLENRRPFFTSLVSDVRILVVVNQQDGTALLSCFKKAATTLVLQTVKRSLFLSAHLQSLHSAASQSRQHIKFFFDEAA
jgi:hypothetical protein